MYTPKVCLTFHFLSNWIGDPKTKTNRTTSTLETRTEAISTVSWLLFAIKHIISVLSSVVVNSVNQSRKCDLNNILAYLLEDERALKTFRDGGKFFVDHDEEDLLYSLCIVLYNILHSTFFYHLLNNNCPCVSSEKWDSKGLIDDDKSWHLFMNYSEERNMQELQVLHATDMRQRHEAETPNNPS